MGSRGYEFERLWVRDVMGSVREVMSSKDYELETL